MSLYLTFNAFSRRTITGEEEREREIDRELYAGIITAGGGEDDKCGMGERIKRKEKKKERKRDTYPPLDPIERNRKPE